MVSPFCFNHHNRTRERFWKQAQRTCMVEPDGMMSSFASSLISDSASTSSLVAKSVHFRHFRNLFLRSQLLVRLVARTLVYAAPLRSDACSSHSPRVVDLLRGRPLICSCERRTTYPCVLRRPEVRLSHVVGPCCWSLLLCNNDEE
jgi:hypothetical protein